MEERIKELYSQGKGIKAISRELDIPISTVRRRLISAGIYQGVDRPVQDQAEDDTSEEPETEILPPALDLEQWEAKGVSIKCAESGGWVLNFPFGFDAEVFSPPWEGNGSEKE